MNCLGCNLANKKEFVHVVFEDNDVCCILDRSPYNEGHVLILSKKHVRYFDELDKHTANSIMGAVALLSTVIKNLFYPDGITVFQNGGLFEDLNHFHIHIIPRYEEQNFAEFYIEDEEVYIEDPLTLEETKKKMTNMLMELK